MLGKISWSQATEKSFQGHELLPRSSVPYPTLKECRKYELLHRSPNNLPSDLRDRAVLHNTPSLWFAFPVTNLFSSPPSHFASHCYCQQLTSLTLSLDFKSTIPPFWVLPITVGQLQRSCNVKPLCHQLSCIFCSLVKPYPWKQNKFVFHYSSGLQT